MKKKILIGLALVFLILQAFRPAKNNSNDNTNHLYNQYAVPDDIKLLLNNACSNCHSNSSEYPWYSNIQPVGWWLNNHIREGKEHFNMSEFTNKPREDQAHQLEEIVETVNERKMPLPSYTWLGLHPEAKLTDQQREAIVKWADGAMRVAASNGITPVRENGSMEDD